MKRNVFLAVALCAVALLMPQTASAYDGLDFILNAETGEAEVRWDAYREPSSIVIPETVTEDGVTYTVTGISRTAFMNCTWLESVTLPATIKRIGNKAFSGCSGLKELVLPDGIEVIGDFAFIDCTGLTELTVPATVTEIGEGAFWCYSGLTLTMTAAVPPTAGEGAFLDIKKMYVPVESGAAYFRADSYPVTKMYCKQTMMEREYMAEDCVGYQMVITTKNGEVITLPTCQLQSVDWVKP